MCIRPCNLTCRSYQLNLPKMKHEEEESAGYQRKFLCGCIQEVTRAVSPSLLCLFQFLKI